MAQASYYSGDLAAINEGRSRDAAIQAEDARSFRNLVAMMAAERNRAQLGNRELGIREALGGRQLDMTGRELDIRDRLGNRELGIREALGGRQLDMTGRELDIRDRLGTEELGLRRELGRGELENQRGRIGADRLGALLRYDVGLRGIEQADTATALNYDAQLKQIEQQADAVKANLDAMKEFYKAGGGTDWRAREAINQREQELAMLEAEANAIANRASIQALEKAKTTPVSRGFIFNDDPWLFNKAGRSEAYTNNPTFGASIRSSVLAEMDPRDAALIEEDPTGARFVPRRSLFTRPGSVATPGINPARQTGLFERYLNTIRQ